MATRTPDGKRSVCDWCDRVFGNQGIAGHERHCVRNPDSATVEPAHATAAALSWHYRHNVPQCEECRAFAKSYRHAARGPHTLAQDRARERAYSRLAKLHPRNFEYLYQRELAKEAAKGVPVTAPGRASTPKEAAA